MRSWKRIVLGAMIALAFFACCLFVRGISPEEAPAKSDPDREPVPISTEPSPGARSASLPAILGRSDPGPELARVGFRSITRKRLELWKQIARLRSGEAETDEDAFFLLFEQALKEAIAERAFGLRPARAELEKKWKELSSDPRNLETLTRIETLFGGDHEAFLAEFIWPAELESELWNRFWKDPEIHRKTHDTAEEIVLRGQRNPKEFLSLGLPGASFSRAVLALSPEGAGRIPEGNPLPRLPSLPVDAGALAQTPSGNLYPSVVETPDTFRVLRVSRQNSGYVEVESWSVPKVRYQDWLIEQGQNVEKSIESPKVRSFWDSLDSKHWLRQVLQ